MSARPNIRKAKPYCKVCHDSGLPEAKYTSHFVRDKPGSDGVVVCPTILSMVCRYCGESGHTSSRCQKLAREERERGKREHERERAMRAAAWNAEEAKKNSSLKAVKASLATGGRFAGLCGDSDSDSEPVKSSKKSESNALDNLGNKTARKQLLNMGIPPHVLEHLTDATCASMFDTATLGNKTARNSASECIATQRAILQKLDTALTPKTKTKTATRIPVREMDWAIESDDDDDL